MTMYATLEEAIDAAREEFLADHPGLEQDEANVQQFNVQKYVLQDGDIMWQVEFFADEGEDGECLPIDAPRDKCAHFREINGIAAAFQYSQKNYIPTALSFL